MFNRAKRDTERIAVLENALATARKHANNIEQIVKQQTVLIAIERSGRVNKFTFIRNNVPFVIETYGSLSDNWQQWKAELLG
jgi:hypothetical protein